jgi:hypothetical protein
MSIAEARMKALDQRLEQNGFPIGSFKDKSNLYKAACPRCLRLVTRTQAQRTQGLTHGSNGSCKLPGAATARQCQHHRQRRSSNGDDATAQAPACGPSGVQRLAAGWRSAYAAHAQGPAPAAPARPDDGGDADMDDAYEDAEPLGAGQLGACHACMSCVLACLLVHRSMGMHACMSQHACNIAALPFTTVHAHACECICMPHCSIWHVTAPR